MGGKEWTLASFPNPTCTVMPDWSPPAPDFTLLTSSVSFGSSISPIHESEGLVSATSACVRILCRAHSGFLSSEGWGVLNTQQLFFFFLMIKKTERARAHAHTQIRRQGRGRSLLQTLHWVQGATRSWSPEPSRNQELNTFLWPRCLISVFNKHPLWVQHWYHSPHTYKN